MDRAESYFLGLIWGDGGVDKNRIKIHCHGSEIAFHNILFREIKNCFDVMPTVYKHTSCNELDIYINRKRVCDMYAPFKCKGIWKLPEVFVAEEIIAGLIDSDGSFSLVKRKTGRVGDWARAGGISISNLVNVELALNLLSGLGYNVKVTVAGTVFVVPFYSYKAYKFVRENIPLKHPHKFDKLRQILNSYKQYPWGLHSLVGEV